jgi:hypothetical protein
VTRRLPKRQRLPNRRQNEVVDITFRGAEYRIAFTRLASGRIAEVFCDPYRVACDVAEDSRDSGLVLSVALQHGVPVDALRATVSRERGRPTSLSGHILDLLASESGEQA